MQAEYFGLKTDSVVIHDWQAYEPNTLLLDNALATMGAGMPSAMAVALLYPQKKVVAVCGDGGFLMNSQVFGPYVGHSLLGWTIDCLYNKESSRLDS